MKIQVIKRDSLIGSVLGDTQWIFSSNKGKISMIELKEVYGKDENLWEIYCLEGDLFEDPKRYDTKKEAEAICKVYLD